MPRVKATEANRGPAAEVRFIEPMNALAVKNLPAGKEWFYEVKFDGYHSQVRIAIISCCKLEKRLEAAPNVAGADKEEFQRLEQEERAGGGGGGGVGAGTDPPMSITTLS